MKQQQVPVISNQVAEVELIYKSKVKDSDRTLIKCSTDSINLLRANWNPDTIELFEEFKVLYLNRANKVIGIYSLSSGGLTGTVADIRLILAAAIRLVSTCIILVHNHPSGSLCPSQTDQALTIKIKQAADLLDIKLLDHIILTKEDGFSFADDGLL